MKPEMLTRIGSPNLERLGAAPHSAELRQMAAGYAEPREFGRRRMNLAQCSNCLAWNKLTAPACPRCSWPVDHEHHDG